MMMTYDNGMQESVALNFLVPRGGESRVIDLRGSGQRSVRRIDFWYDTAGLGKGQAEVTVFGMK